MGKKAEPVAPPDTECPKPTEEESVAQDGLRRDLVRAKISHTAVVAFARPLGPAPLPGFVFVRIPPVPALPTPS